MSRRTRRSGAVLVAAMVCLLVAVSIVSSMIVGTLQRHSHLRALHRVRQAEVLVITGRDRALARLRTEPDYKGETWTARLTASARSVESAVTISIAKDEDDSTRRIEVAVVYPINNPRSVKRSGAFTLPAAASTDTNAEDS